MAAVARVDSRNSSNCYKASEPLDDNDSLPRHVSHPKPVSTPLPDEAQIKAALYSPSVTAKIWGVASRTLDNVSIQPIPINIHLPSIPPTLTHPIPRHLPPTQCPNTPSQTQQDTSPPPPISGPQASSRAPSTSSTSDSQSIPKPPTTPPQPNHQLNPSKDPIPQNCNPPLAGGPRTCTPKPT